MLEAIHQAKAFIESRTSLKPTVGVILGTGLGALVNEIEVQDVISYSDIPHFPVSTVESHSGKLIFGKLSGKSVVVMQGRFHYYEGYSLQEVTFPVRVMKFLGVKNLFISNACGSVNPNMKRGSLMLIKDHINLLPDNPLRGKHYPELGPRFPDMSEPYNRSLLSQAMQYIGELDIKVHQGVYAVVPGPNLETKAEYDYLHKIGADVVGMSTVPEVIVANSLSMPCMALTVITDEGFGELHPLTLEEVISVASKAEPFMTKLMQRVIENL